MENQNTIVTIHLPKRESFFFFKNRSNKYQKSHRQIGKTDEPTVYRKESS